jgi:hypothetical protein
LQLVLDLAMFYEKAVVGPVRIYGQACSTTFGVSPGLAVAAASGAS